ncbi:DUF3021 family protein [Clostridium tertium]|jgi:hypothetical protein|uniref:DUF3021 family protein n=1 Tax=Clostridium TaxID=1485 RepID=UPI00019B05F0|nr:MULTISPECIES: DUF3021 family protein [Clostridium]EEH98993.1 hypothetical protein CSBG_02619 [Clostridium sp. 7_2_43FAA]MDB1955759.1 DUF3021 family protein [Clostridium tertium]MDB1957486.1 DUF3021 family protein [Clostridium tertium]MDB1961404.1 DUF3021 family protein [Clostridium tertium]MDB1966962.1 DUF3021 family protein [Clostridium tertium]
MKNFYNIGYEVKALIGLFFTMIILTYGVVSFFIENKIMPLELLWEFILLAIIVGLIQFILYNEKFLSKISIKTKTISHYLILLGVLSIFIKYFNWIELWGISFKIFFIIYTAYFILVTLNFYVYKKITGERFNDKLLKYKENL